MADTGTRRHAGRGATRLLVGLALAAPAAQAEDAPAPAYKLTLGRYHGSASGNATDLNLRPAVGSGNVWLGLYDAPTQAERQWRLGGDAEFTLGALRLMPAAQLVRRSATPHARPAAQARAGGRRHGSALGRHGHL